MTMTENVTHAESNARAWMAQILQRRTEYLAALDEDDYATTESINEWASEAPLSVQVRDDWRDPYADDQPGPAEFRILLTTGGPALQLVGELDSFQSPDANTIELQCQDWGTPWMPLPVDGDERDALEWFADQLVILA